MTAPADEAWKVMICAQETRKAQETLSFLAYILESGVPGILSSDQMLECISKHTGPEIAQKIEHFIRRRLASVDAAIAKKD